MPTALIVGASRGLGRALAEEHLKRGWKVIATVRDASSLDDLKAQAGDALDVETLDVTDWAGVDALHERLKGRRLDLLFVNAGISGPTGSPIGDTAPEAFVETMLVNALAPARILDRYADLVAEDGVFAAMTSELGSIAGNRSAGWEAYRMSKAALNMGLKSVAIRRGNGLRSFLAVHPGWVRTELGGLRAPLGVEDSAPRIVDLLERRRGGGDCAFVAYDGRELPW